MPIETLAADDSALFLWASYPMLPEALYCIKAWGFFYKTNAFTWIKGNRKADSDFFGMGQWTRRNSEICLLATKGNLKAIDHSISELVYAPIGNHSEKPAEIKDLIVKLCGDLPRIELFARSQTQGWDVFGNEVEGSIRLPTPLALDGASRAEN
jgi:N6-adenosine-specific RNA methylase IME4